MVSEVQRQFLEVVRDDGDVFAFLDKHDIGFGWAIELGLVTKHPAFFEFYLTEAGRAALATEQPNE
jgi:hypothetical protein